MIQAWTGVSETWGLLPALLALWSDDRLFESFSLCTFCVPYTRPFGA